MISFISRSLNIRDKKYFVVTVSLFLFFSLMSVFFYNLGGLTVSLKISFVGALLLFSFLVWGNWKFFLSLYILSIPFAPILVMFTPYYEYFYKGFAIIYIETRNIWPSYSFFAKSNRIYLYNFLELLGIIVLMQAFLKEGHREDKRLYIFLLTFLVLSSISIFTSINPFRAFIELVHLSLSVVMFVLFLHYFGREESFDRKAVTLILITIFLLTASVLSKKAIIDLLKGNFFQREQGRFGNPNPPGLLAGMGVLLFAYLFFKEPSAKKIFYILGFGLFLLIILCTGSRNALISTVLSVGFFSFLGFRTKTGKKKDFILPSFLILVFAGFIVYLGKIIFILRLNPSLLRFDSSLWSRFVLWINSIKYIIKNPLKPIGLGNFPYFEGSLGGLPFAHNLFINTLVESGIVPFLMLVYAAFLGFKVIFRILGRWLKGKITVEEAIAASIFLYLSIIFQFDQFPYYDKGWRYTLLILAFAISRFHKRPVYIK